MSAPSRIKAWGHGGDSRPIRGFAVEGEPGYDDNESPEYIRKDPELVERVREGVSVAEAAGVPDRDEWHRRRIAHPDQRGMEVHPPGAFVMAWALRDVLKAMEG